MIASSEDVEPGTSVPRGSVESNMCLVDEREDARSETQASQVGTAKRDFRLVYVRVTL